MELRIEKRITNGKTYIAPFINDWNVWEIPEEQWSGAVGQAIIHAYEIGAKHQLVAAKRALAADDMLIAAGLHDAFPSV